MAPDGPNKSTPESELRAAIDALEGLTERKVLVLVRPFDHLLAERLEAEFTRAFGEAPPDADLDIVLESDGGDADAAYGAALLVRASVGGSVRVLVPSWAKSAATLFSFCADRISMPPAKAQLGPLDAQVTDPRNPALPMSALDGYQSVEYIRDYALQTQHLAVRQMLDRTRARVPLGEILDRASAFARDVVSPIMSQVRPLDFGGWGRTLDIGKVYAERLLERFNMVTSDADPAVVANQFVYGYPHHGFHIDLDEATTLGLSTESMPADIYSAASAVVSAAFDCQQEVCEDGNHRPGPGYTGFSPEKPTKRKHKEVKSNGADKAELARSLRHHHVPEEQRDGDDEPNN
ncbi:MAG: SDH family Clp fold serine proteinase [Gaiellaceae bacterium]